jgi:ABC-type polysaccharide/polyol phosphate export permease
MLGRGIMSVIDASISVLLTFTIAYLIFSILVPGGLGINLALANYPLLALTLILGALNWLAIGFILSAVNLLSAKLQFTLQEYVISVFYLFGGVIFAPSILPSWGQSISNILPIRYFLAAVRLSFSSCAQDCLPVNTTLLYLAASTLAIVLAGVLLFTVAEHRCRRLGLIDQKAEY